MGRGLSVDRLPVRLILVQPVGLPGADGGAFPLAAVDIGSVKDYRHEESARAHMSDAKYAKAPSGDAGTPDPTVEKGLNNCLTIVAIMLFVTGVALWTAAIFIYQSNTGDESVTSFMITLRLEAEHMVRNPLSLL